MVCTYVFQLPCIITITLFSRSLINKGIGGNNNLPTSEQMQPLYAMKETVQELLRKVEQLQSQVQVCPVCFDIVIIGLLY